LSVIFILSRQCSRAAWACARREGVDPMDCTKHMLGTLFVSLAIQGGLYIYCLETLAR